MCLCVQVGNCFHLAKNAGFKVIAHMMPDLPNVGWERDMESFREFFENPAFRTDGLKVSDMQAAWLGLHTGPDVCSSCCNQPAGPLDQVFKCPWTV